jgi:hypothetical protein
MSVYRYVNLDIRKAQRLLDYWLSEDHTIPVAFYVAM